MTLYRVDVEERRNWTLYIEADDEDEAEEAAMELTAGFDSDFEEEAYATRATGPIKDREEVWVGGEDGQFISYAEYKGGLGA